jgi:selenide,water dikinase
MPCIEAGLISGAVERNREYAKPFVRLSAGVTEEMETVLYDPQTSGGLLVAVRKSKLGPFLEALSKGGVRRAAVIGRVRAKGKARIVLMKKAPKP